MLRTFSPNTACASMAGVGENGNSYFRAAMWKFFTSQLPCCGMYIMPRKFEPEMLKVVSSLQGPLRPPNVRVIDRFFHSKKNLYSVTVRLTFKGNPGMTVRLYLFSPKKESMPALTTEAHLVY